MPRTYTFFKHAFLIPLVLVSAAFLLQLIAGNRIPWVADLWDDVSMLGFFFGIVAIPILALGLVGSAPAAGVYARAAKVLLAVILTLGVGAFIYFMNDSTGISAVTLLVYTIPVLALASLLLIIATDIGLRSQSISQGSPSPGSNNVQ